MATLSRAAFVVLPTLLITAIVLGSSRVRTGQSQDSMTSTKAEPTSLLDLLDDAQADASTKQSPRTPAAAGANPETSAGVGSAVPSQVPAVPPAAETVNLVIRVALVSRSPITSIQTSPGMVCRSVGGGPRLDDRTLMALVQSTQRGHVRCSGGTILINQVPYRHAVELLRRNQQWIAINELDLEHYVASVVGAEMPSHWNLEALKAQAVAARSYALAHLARPASGDFHLGDTTRWQVFGGERSRSQRTQAATSSTRGIILSYKGGIVESLYAANSSISAEAHGHLGASMSQEGAQQLAQTGLEFNEILGSYYRGASLARLSRDDG